MKTSDAIIAVRFEARIWREETTGTKEQRNETTGKYEDVPVTYPAEWAVYDVESGVRLAYTKDADEAQRKAEKWNAGEPPAVVLAKAESARHLRELLKPGDTVKTILRHCSRSGMSRRISLVIARDSEVIDITWHAARVMGDAVKQGGKYVQDAGMVVGGCGMDMGFHLVYNLGRVLFPDGFVCPGDTCPSNDHYNDRSAGMKRENFKGKMHAGDGGYALKHSWL